MPTKGERYSNHELLRLFCIWGIVSMHSIGPLLQGASGLLLLYANAINTIFNTGVSLFVLISGYFSIKSTPKKIFSFLFQIIVFSLIHWLIISNATNSYSLKSFSAYLFPISANKHWFATSYLVLMIFAPILNKISDSQSKEAFKKTIITFLFFFSIIPSMVLIYKIPGCGKGSLHLIMMYLIGRYIALFIPLDICRKKIALTTSICLFFIFITNYIATYLYRISTGTNNVFFPWSGDTSIFIITASVGIFLLVRSCNFHSQAINILAKNVFCIYLMEGAFRLILNHYIQLSDFTHLYTFPIVLFCWVLIIMIAGIITNSITQPIVSLVSSIIWNHFEQCLSKIYRIFDPTRICK